MTPTRRLIRSKRAGEPRLRHALVAFFNSAIERQGARLNLAKSLLSPHDRRLLLATKELLDELLETKEVLRDKELMRSIRESERDARAGRLYTIGQLKRQLRKEGRL